MNQPACPNCQNPHNPVPMLTEEMTCPACGRDCREEYSGMDPIADYEAFENLHSMVKSMWKAYIGLYYAGSTLDSLVLLQLKHKIDALVIMHDQESEQARNARLPEDYGKKKRRRRA